MTIGDVKLAEDPCEYCGKTNTQWRVHGCQEELCLLSQRHFGWEETVKMTMGGAVPRERRNQSRSSACMGPTPCCGSTASPSTHTSKIDKWPLWNLGFLSGFVMGLAYCALLLW